MHTRIKICGLTEPKGIAAAIDAGVDALGFVFYQASSRAVTFERFQSLVENWPPFVDRVALWVNAAESDVKRVVATGLVDLLQFHGTESPEYCEQFGLPYIKALRPKAETDWLAVMSAHTQAAGFILDAGSDNPQARTGQWGGTGHVFDWSLWPEQATKPLILAGGLNPQNVSEAIKRLRPFAVDVSGGVEASPGVKDQNKIQDFVREVLCCAQQ